MRLEPVAPCFVDLVNSCQIGCFEIASGQPIQLRELILTFAHALGRPDLIKLGVRPERVGEPEIIIAPKVLALSMKTSLQDAISKTIEYWRQEIA